MRVLIIKMSSLGDVIHTLPALTDAKKNRPEIQFDWLIEPAFAEIPRWHPAVNQIIVAPFRQFKKNWRHLSAWKKMFAMMRTIRKNQYDVILDAQGLLKSALPTIWIKGKKLGLHSESIKEKYASYFYDQKIQIEKNQHAILRLRQLFAKSFNYPVPLTLPDFHIQYYFSKKSQKSHEKYVVFLHGTTWHSKQYPKNYWKQLAAYCLSKGYAVKMTYGNDAEKIFVMDLQKEIAIDIFKKDNLTNLAEELSHASAIIGVDTGLTHLAAALGVPTIALYGATSSKLTGAIGSHCVTLAAQFPCAPCLMRECRYQGVSQEKPACYDTIASKHVMTILDQILF